MKLIKDGTLYVSGNDAEEAFFTNLANIGRFRRQGMPFELINDVKTKANATKNDRYCYPVEKCRRWFAGVEVMG